MKITDLKPQEELDEASLKHMAAAGILGTALATSGGIKKSDDVPSQEKPRDEIVVTAPRVEKPDFGIDIDIPAPNLVQRVELARNIAKKYRVNSDLVQQVVDLAYRYEDKEFPRAADILAIVGVESSFNPNSKSQLRTDPAIGLMQVRPGVWNIKPEDLSSVEAQIKIGAQILKRYFKKTGNAEDTVQAYNVGITRFRRGVRNARYVSKYQNELRFLDT